MNYLFSTKTVAGLVDASVRQVDHWVRTGLLKPSAREASGKGSRRRFTFVDVVAMKVISKLRERGCSLPKIREAVRYLKKQYPEDSDSRMLAQLTLLTDGKKVYLLTDERQIMEVLTHQHVWSLAIGQIITEIRSQVEALSTEWTETVKVGGAAYHLIVVRDGETGTFTAQCKELPGAIEQGDTAEEANENGKEAIRSALAFMNKRRTMGARRVQAG